MSIIEEAISKRQAIDSFMEKLSGVNKPYKSLKLTDEYKAFHKTFSDAIQKQAASAANNINDILYLAHPLSALNDSQKTDMTNRVKAQLTPLTKIINLQVVADYYKFCFEWGAKAQYQRWFTHKSKASDSENFKLTNKKYIDALNNRANYLLSTKSSLDETTSKNIIDTIISGKEDNLTNDEVASMLSDGFDDISNSRADMIARTETANAMGQGNYATMIENGIDLVDWVTAGDNPCPICEENEDASPIDVSQDSFPSGDDHEPAHPNCECYTQADTSNIDLDSISIWGGE